MKVVYFYTEEQRAKFEQAGVRGEYFCALQTENLADYLAENKVVNAEIMVEGVKDLLLDEDNFAAGIPWALKELGARASKLTVLGTQRSILDLCLDLEVPGARWRRSELVAMCRKVSSTPILITDYAPRVQVSRYLPLTDGPMLNKTWESERGSDIILDMDVGLDIVNVLIRAKNDGLKIKCEGRLFDYVLSALGDTKINKRKLSKLCNHLQSISSELAELYSDSILNGRLPVRAIGLLSKIKSITLTGCKSSDIVKELVKPDHFELHELIGNKLSAYYVGRLLSELMNIDYNGCRLVSSIRHGGTVWKIVHV